MTTVSEEVLVAQKQFVLACLKLKLRQYYSKAPQELIDDTVTEIEVGMHITRTVSDVVAVRRAFIMLARNSTEMAWMLEEINTFAKELGQFVLNNTQSIVDEEFTPEQYMTEYA